MKPSDFALGISLIIGGLAIETHPKAKVPKRVAGPVSFAKSSEVQAYSGNYYRGDGTGYNVYLKLKTDGSYIGTWRGCMGVYGTAKGKWSIQGQQIVLKPAVETDMMKGHLCSLDISREQKKVLLLPTADRKKVAEQSRWGKPRYLFFTKR
jgi:hypothetical protein